MGGCASVCQSFVVWPVCEYICVFVCVRARVFGGGVRWGDGEGSICMPVLYSACVYTCSVSTWVGVHLCASAV